MFRVRGIRRGAIIAGTAGFCRIAPHPMKTRPAGRDRCDDEQGESRGDLGTVSASCRRPLNRLPDWSRRAVGLRRPRPPTGRGMYPYSCRPRCVDSPASHPRAINLRGAPAPRLAPLLALAPIPLRRSRRYFFCGAVPTLEAAGAAGTSPPATASPPFAAISSRQRFLSASYLALTAMTSFCLRASSAS